MDSWQIKNQRSIKKSHTSMKRIICASRLYTEFRTFNAENIWISHRKWY